MLQSFQDSPVGSFVDTEELVSSRTRKNKHRNNKDNNNIILDIEEQAIEGRAVLVQGSESRSYCSPRCHIRNIVPIS